MLMVLMRQVMGACLCHYVPNVTNFFTFRYFKHTGLHEEDDQIKLEECEDEENHCNAFMRSKLLSLFSFKFFKRKSDMPISLELVENSCWRRKSNKYSLLELATASNRSLQTLDAKVLLQHQRCFSSASSSLDLEWEHEVNPLTTTTDNKCQSHSTSSKSSCHNSPASSLTESPWSKVSTPNSLEWDSIAVAENGSDADTEKLLTEIEKSTYKTLRETGDWSGVR